MNKEQILQTIQKLALDTKLKAWMFNIDNDYYHIAAYSAFRVGDRVSIWKANKKGKRISDEPIFFINGKDHLICIERFIEKLEKQAEV